MYFYKGITNILPYQATSAFVMYAAMQKIWGT
jgi:hypothetical protein